MSSSGATTKVTTIRGDDEAGVVKQWVVYKVVMTPIVFVSFLVSLAWTDFRYTIQRSHSHDSVQGRMPSWLHRLVYRPTPYQYVKVKETTAQSRENDKWASYYHTKQKKLLRMEAEDAFRIRGHILIALATIPLVVIWGLWVLFCKLWASWT